MFSGRALRCVQADQMLACAHRFVSRQHLYDASMLPFRSQPASLRRSRMQLSMHPPPRRADRYERTATGPTLAGFIAEEGNRSHEYGVRSIFSWEPARTGDEAATGRT